MKRIAMAALVLLVGLTSLSLGSELEPPPDGKAVVYIGRMTGFVGRARPFHFFADDQYLARVKGKAYVRHVCDPGTHIFWIAAENRTFVKADLEAGRSYALFARMQAGTWSAGAQLQPLTEQSEAWNEFRDMLKGKRPEQASAKYLEAWGTKHPTYIEQALSEWKAAGEPAIQLQKDEYFQWE